MNRLSSWHNVGGKKQNLRHEARGMKHEARGMKHEARGMKHEASLMPHPSCLIPHASRLIPLLSALLLLLATASTALAVTEFVSSIKESGMSRQLTADLIDGYRNPSLWFEFTLDSFIHSLGKACGNPDFAALLAKLDRDIFKEIKATFYQAVERRGMTVQPAAALCAQNVFHRIFSLRVLGSSHLAGSNQWTVMI